LNLAKTKPGWGLDTVSIAKDAFDLKCSEPKQFIILLLTLIQFGLAWNLTGAQNCTGTSCQLSALTTFALTRGASSLLITRLLQQLKIWS
jgi:hypothetical protein